MLEISKSVQRRLEKPFETTFWGNSCICRSAFCPTVLGDGYQLLALTPMDTRPNYYLIRVHSSWDTSNYEPSCIADHLDEIYDAIEDYFGRVEYEDAAGKICRADWPSFEFGSGQCWSSAMDLIRLEPNFWEPRGWWGLKPLTTGNFDCR